jgi:hypothetical protein
MSDTNLSSPHDAAIETVRERVRQLAADIALHKARMEGATLVHDELVELIATLTRKARPKKPRPVGASTSAPIADSAEEPARPTVFAAAATSDAGNAPGTFPPGTFPPGTFAPRPTVFATPSNDAGDMAAAA